MKRFFDMFVALTFLLLTFPIFILVSVLVATKLGFPIVYTQLRPGLHGKVFKILKFRTMTNEVDEQGVLLPNKDRLTNFGRLLRSTSLDEMPGLINVLKGDMSLVGPRPLLVEYIPLYNARQSLRHNVRPGITGWAQVNGRNAISWEKKFDLDVWYVENQSFLLDVKILFMTLHKVIGRKDVNSSADVTMEKFRGSHDQ